MENRDFHNFAVKIGKRRAPLNGRSYNRYGYRELNSVSCGSLSLKEIQDIMEGGDLTALRQLSYYYYRISGIYRNAIIFLSRLSLYQTLVTPIFDNTKKVAQDVMLRRYQQALKFVDNLEVPLNFSRVTWKVLLAGAYYGIFREDNDNITLQDLPEAYCRTRFKDCNNLNIVEFNLQYFETINDDKMRLEAIAAYPSVITQAWRKYVNGALTDPWVSIPPSAGGCCFQYYDATPLYISSIPDIYRLEEANAREAKRDENELYKLLIERMPIDSKGQLVFTLDEVADIHASVAEMLEDIETVDVLTTFGDAKLESVQDTTSASQSTDRLEKYKNTVYNNIGLSSLYFNADTSSSMPYANSKDEAVVQYLTDQYAKWIEMQVNLRYAKTNLIFDVSILPTTRINRKDIQSQYFQGAQYGYSKMAAGVAMGLKQITMIPTMVFENDYLHMSENMIPLMSSFTSSGKSSSSTTTENSSTASDITNSGGRPQLDDEERSDRTQDNIDGKS